MNRMTQELELGCLDQLEATSAILRGLMCGLSEAVVGAGWPQTLSLR
jgi:hypothetical protein